MTVSKKDMQELQRMATNTYDEDKACVARVIRGVNDLLSENAHLKAEIERLKTVKK